MNINTTSAAYIYLLLVPFIAAGLGFGVGHVSYTIYLPVWIVNATLMVAASWKLGLKSTRSSNDQAGKLALTAFYWIIPWILISMFAGLGPPPETATEWTATSSEQQIRYFMLVISGVFIALGFAGLRNILKNKGETTYSLLGVTVIFIAIPLFIINMLYWGFYLTELFKIQVTTQATVLPDSFMPVKELFGLVSVIEVALTYLATFAIAMALKKVGWINRTATFFYVLLSLLACVIIILSAFFTETFKTPGFAVSIPAFPFLMLYFLGVNLLKRSGSMENT